ncbi:CHAT domain-containing protein [Paenibacillus sp. GP183]|uniref:CHAT domain-containing protein n=1 Tax=Paenibacillus sp. GP183 TaxID=1882751 RepID=UPI000B803903|nr:CHAT domain-containing protein [Paenibacillus sp. GP183]
MLKLEDSYKFLEEYADPSYDLIWVISHGMFNYDDAPNSKIVLDDYYETSLKTLIEKIPPLDKRRLLVLNACQSGCSPVRYDGMGFIGFGPTLANQNQSVIGNLWKVNSLSASIYGSLLLTYLVEGEEWSTAVNKAKHDFQKGDDYVIDLLSKRISPKLQLYEQIRRIGTDDLKKIYLWGAYSG